MTVLLQRSVLVFFASLVSFWLANTHNVEANQDIPVDLELVLAVDVSNSMDGDERLLQRQGYEAAFRHDDVIETIKSGLLGRVAVTYIEWADSGRQNVTVPWMLVDSDETANAFADKLAEAKLLRMRRTSIGDALLFSASQFEDNGFAGMRRVIDVSGDGPSNEGWDVASARDKVIARGIVINGLPIVLKKPSYYDEKLDIYYEDCVIGGPGSFLITIREQGEFIKAIRQKILLEIASSAPKVWNAQLWYRRPPRVSCSSR